MSAPEVNSDNPSLCRQGQPWLAFPTRESATLAARWWHRVGRMPFYQITYFSLSPGRPGPPTSVVNEMTFNLMTWDGIRVFECHCGSWHAETEVNLMAAGIPVGGETIYHPDYRQVDAFLEEMPR